MSQNGPNAQFVNVLLSHVLFHSLRLPKEIEHFLGLDYKLVFHEVYCNRFDFPIAEHACKIQFLIVDILEKVFWGDAVL